MKAALLVVLVSAARADECTLAGSFGKLDVSCSIPSAAEISSKCCAGIQAGIKKGLAHQRPTPQEQQELMQECQSFQMYVMQHMPHGPPPHSPQQRFQQVINALPDGLTCTEKITGGGESGCGVHASVGKLGVKCAIPKETTISPQCCSDIQAGIDMGMAHQQPTPQWKQKTMQDCQSFQMYAMQHMPRGPPPHNPEERMNTVINALPGGLSCTETISGGDLATLYADHTVLAAISSAAMSSVQPEYEQASEPVVEKKSKVALAVIVGLGFNCCGVDRCYLGNIVLGVVKGITLGGLGIWALIDWIVIFINMLQKKLDINNLGMTATFEDENDANTAFWITIVFFVLHLCTPAAKTASGAGGRERISNVDKDDLLNPGSKIEYGKLAA
jgi:TM2 domain-containing membrane protein YozV